jgi:polysaccharide deacetylase family protein (PEP-CTERM system associated)
MAEQFRLKQWTALRRGGRVVNALSVDVEDYFHAQALSYRVSPEQWDGLERRVDGNTRRILELFASAGVKATFFVLGWVAERHPDLVHRIVAEGHELASHGWNHTRVDRQTPQEFAADLRRSKRLLEDLGGVAVRGYRAATFSISHRNPWAFAVLEEEGFAYSSSVYPVRHDYYGMPMAPRFAFYPSPDGQLEEYPMTSVRLGQTNLPCSGGGYFRLLPYALSRWALRRVNGADGQPVIFYFHPWEIDAGQPRIAGLPMKSRLRHYTNLGTMEGRVRRLLGDFAWDRLDRVLLDPVADRPVAPALSPAPMGEP